MAPVSCQFILFPQRNPSRELTWDHQNKHQGHSHLNREEGKLKGVFVRCRNRPYLFLCGIPI